MDTTINTPGEHHLTTTRDGRVGKKQARFLEVFWELKILFWGLVFVALVYAVMYLTAYV